MRILLVLLLCLPGWANAEIYEWQDANGSKHFSDRPVVDAKIVDIKPGYDFYRVKTVYDGDTVVLEDGRKIRFLGINTPEVQHRDKQADAGGDEAKRWLTDQLKNTKVRLEVGTEKTDKYGRTLAHLFTEKRNISTCNWLPRVWRQSVFTRPIYTTSMNWLRRRIRRSKLNSAFGDDLNMP